MCERTLGPTRARLPAASIRLDRWQSCETGDCWTAGSRSCPFARPTPHSLPCGVCDGGSDRYCTHMFRGCVLQLAVSPIVHFTLRPRQLAPVSCADRVRNDACGCVRPGCACGVLVHKPKITLKTCVFCVLTCPRLRFVKHLGRSQTSHCHSKVGAPCTLKQYHHAPDDRGTERLASPHKFERPKTLLAQPPAEHEACCDPPLALSVSCSGRKAFKMVVSSLCSNRAKRSAASPARSHSVWTCP